WKDERRPMIVLAILKMCGGGWLTAGRRHSKQRTGGVRREQNRAVRLPRASARERGIRESLNRLALDIEALQFSIGKKTDRPAVWRPERKRRAFGSCQR